MTERAGLEHAVGSLTAPLSPPPHAQTAFGSHVVEWARADGGGGHLRWGRVARARALSSDSERAERPQASSGWGEAEGGGTESLAAALNTLGPHIAERGSQGELHLAPRLPAQA